MATDLAYFMGQGKVYLAPRIAGGAISGGFSYVGDADICQLTAAQKFDDVEESYSGNRLVAAHIPIGLSYAVKLNCLQWSMSNIIKATYGKNFGINNSGSVTGELAKAWGASMALLANPGASAVVAKLGGAATTLASVSVTAAGTGALAAGTVVTAAAVGMTATVAPVVNAVIGIGGGVDHYEVVSNGSGISVPPTSFTVAGVSGLTQAVHMGAVSLVLNTDYTVDADNGALNFLPGSILVPGANAIPDSVGTPISVDYSYASWNGQVEAVLAGIKEYAIFVKGMNTANGNAPVLITMWRYAMDLAKTLDFITSKHGALELSGMLLPDPTRDGVTQSQFYTIRKV